MTASFMKPFVTEKKDWWLVDGDAGSICLPADMFTRAQAREQYGHRHCRKARYSVKRFTGYGARMSADGYMDCTEWAVFDTVEEAEKYLRETYLDDEEEGETTE